jgi:hypothetical protein
MVPGLNELECFEILLGKRTDVDMGLVTSEGCVVPHAVHVSAGALQSESILKWVNATLVARGAHKDLGKARHGVLESNHSNSKADEGQTGNWSR